MLTTALIILLAASSAHAQEQPGTAVGCPATERAILDVQRAERDAFEHNDLATLDRLLDEQLIYSSDNGKRLSKQEALASLKAQLNDNKTMPDGPIKDVVLKFEDGVAILNFVDGMRNVDLRTGMTMSGSFRESFVFGCRGGQWKIIFRSEVQIPNANRVHDSAMLAHLDEYVGHYVFYQNGYKGDVHVFRKGDKLFEAWGPGQQQGDEILPGRFDTFFARYDGTVEQFVRDRSGIVVGIHYVMWDSDFEARRVRNSSSPHHH
jgi:Domain of unknown function (DUF4440)